MKALKLLVISILIHAGLIAPAEALVRFECGIYRVVAKIDKHDLVIYPGALSEKRIENSLSDESLRATQKKGVPDGAQVRVRIRVSGPEFRPDGTQRRESYQVLSIEPASPSDLNSTSTSSAVIRETQEDCALK